MATYYIDFTAGDDANAGTSTAAPWKRAPGMTGFTGSHTSADGDQFIFKGGETWTSAVYPWTIANSGGSGNPDVYTVDDTWFTGGGWTQPVFDAQATEPASGMLRATTKNNLTFNDLKFVNYGTTGVAEAKKAFEFTNCQGLTFTDLTLECYCWITIYCVFTTAGTYSDFTFSGCDCSHTGGGMIWFASAAANITRGTVTVTNNTIHDHSSQIGTTGGNEVHGDALWHSFSTPAQDSTQPLLNVEISNNRFYGDFRRSFGSVGNMTSFIFVEDYMTGRVFNNDIAPSPTQASFCQSFIQLEALTGTTVEVYNNSLYATGVNPGSASMYFGGNGAGGTLIVKNNNSIGFQYAVSVERTGGTITFDNNVWYSIGVTDKFVFGSTFQTYAEWQTDGRDVNGILGSDPIYVNPPDNLRLQATSPALLAGENLTSLGYTNLNSDRDSSVRPSSGAWDAGAYNYTDYLPRYTLRFTA